ncbi:MAG: helix-turn-helix transcriptional regulator [Clostridia bacterium]|nr:helix-turn-helix transcriptional regulator [Clostridia bacterium]
MENITEFKNFVRQRFAIIRNSNNISARKLSIEMGQGTEYINQIENGRKMPSLEGLYNFCDYFKISLSEFFDTSQMYPIQYKEIIGELNKLDLDELEHITKNIRLINRSKK